MKPILDIKGLCKTFADGTVALDEVDLAIRRGEIFALLGPNGAGNTTLIGAVCGLVRPTGGTIYAFGKDMSRHWRELRRRVGLLPREGAADDIVWCAVEPCYVFHVANAYDREDGAVVVDVCAYETMFDGGMKGPNGRNLGLERWTIDPVAKTVERLTLEATPQEFPRPDERFFGRPYRYAWSVALPDAEVAQFMGASCLIAHYLVAGTRTVRDFGPGRLPGEFVFVPRSDDAREGDGWLMGLVIDIAADTTDLVILDAQDITAPAVATVHLPRRIPPGFHGNWIAA